jgi:hypothetical protein
MALGSPQLVLLPWLEVDLENPLGYIRSAFTDGTVPARYAWNAIRKIYELLRLLQEGHNVSSTLEVVQGNPELLRPAVPSENSDGSIPWGPFSCGGAVIRTRTARSVVGGRPLVMTVMTSFSVWRQEEDDAVANEAAEWLLSVSQ